MTILACVCLLLPGMAWWVWLGQRQEDPIFTFAQTVGISLAMIPLLALAGFVTGLRFSVALIVILLLACLLLVVGGLIRHGFWLPRRYRLHLVIGLAAFGSVVAWRLYQARDLLLPNWVDSQHHFLIIKTILESGGVPQDLMPYLPMPFYYHFGNHAVTALFTAVSNLPIGQAMLVLGQVLNAAVGLSVYALGKTLWRNWRPALAAALLVSFATRMPAYYLSWGRYTLLTGLALLPLAMGQAINLVRGKQRWVSALTLALLTAGLLLTHYFAALLLAVFIVLLALGTLLHDLRHLPKVWIGASAALNSVLAGVLLAAPWLWRVAQFTPSNPGIDARWPESIEAVLTGGNADYIWKLLGPASNHWLLLPAGLGLLFALCKRHTLSFGVWSLTLALMALPWGLTLSPFRSDHFAIVLFIPIALLTGGLFWWCTRQAERLLKQRWVGTLLLVLLVLGWCAWGFSDAQDVANPTTVLATEADLAALDWITENTPPEARFFINTTYWQGGVYRGVDGGGWLLPYTGRWSLVPTIFYGFSPDADWTGELRGWGEAASQVSTCSEDFWNLVEEAELDWVYLRKGVGSLQPEGLVGCPGVEEVYEDGEVWVYKIER
ncbi:MAG TPA: hypothetical protein PLE10_08985 [Brevefilum sp.]|nr:hypothetical protein [Brevefilum sp.]HOR19938.1 hypothetical protein [Brevefilum sp.]